MKALLLVDIQNGFCPGGNLAVPDGDEVVPVANKLVCDGDYDHVFLSQDWHPEGHGSFASSHPGKKPFEMGELGGKPQLMWPDHCVQGTEDAAFHPELDLGSGDFTIVQKGMDPEIDSYSAFRDNAHGSETRLADLLRGSKVVRLDVCGLATDFCVKATALDAVEMLPGVEVRFVEDASRGISPEGVTAAVEEMRAAGVKIVRSAEIVS